MCFRLTLAFVEWLIGGAHPHQYEEEKERPYHFYHQPHLQKCKTPMNCLLNTSLNMLCQHTFALFSNTMEIIQSQAETSQGGCEEI